jgi:REP element-mobilizing transposase RayT
MRLKMGCMLYGFHVIFSTYGFWLPNDPRGSWSDWVRRWELLRFGKATKVDTRSSVAEVDHDRELRRAAKSALKYPEVRLSGKQARVVGMGFWTAANEGGYSVYALSILPQHVHMVLGPHKRRVTRVVGHFKARATQQLSEVGLRPLAGYLQADGTIPSPRGRNCWKVFLYSEEHLRQAIAYVERNPLKEGKPGQRWSVVQSYPGWKLGPGARSKLRR